MKVLQAKKVSYTPKEEGPAYFQVKFEGEREGEEEYVLMQRAFEMPGGGEIYFENQDMEDSGYYVIKKAKLCRDRMKIKLPGWGGTSWEIRFEIEAERYAEMAGDLRAIFSKPNRIELETEG